MSLKRKCESSSNLEDGLPEVKKQRSEVKINILELSDCVLVSILKFLDTTALYQLGRSCTRFERLVTDPKFWQYVDGRRSPNTSNKIQFVFDNTGKNTKHLLLAGDKRSDHLVSLSVIVKENFLTNLSVLALENQLLDGKEIKLNMFPKTLEELSFRRSFILNYRTFFKTSSEAMSNLRVLLLDHCQWVETDTVLSLSKFSKLEILSFYMCKKVADHNNVYLSLIGRFGFTNLKVFDARFTGLGSEWIKSFHCSNSLQEIYFQSYCTTYREERAERKAKIESSDYHHKDTVSYVSDDEDNDDSSLSHFRQRFGGSNLSKFRLDTMDDESIRYYTRARSTAKGTTPTRPSSVLYKYPYPERCTCGFYDTFWENKGSSHQPSSSSSDCNLKSPPVKIVRDSSSSAARSPVELSKNGRSDDSMYLLQIDPVAYNRFRSNLNTDVPLPDYIIKPSSPRTKDRRWIGLRDPVNDYEIAMIEHTDYQVESYAIENHSNSLDFTNPVAVSNALNQDVRRRPIQVYRGHSRLIICRSNRNMFFDSKPTFEVLSFATEFTVNCARLTHLVYDESSPILRGRRISYIIKDGLLEARCGSRFIDTPNLVKNLSKTVSCLTRKVLRAFAVGVTVLMSMDITYKFQICTFVRKITDHVANKCESLPQERLRDVCDELRANIPYEYGIYMNEIPENYDDAKWGFKLEGDEVNYSEESSMDSRTEMGDCGDEKEAKKECSTLPSSSKLQSEDHDNEQKSSPPPQNERTIFEGEVPSCSDRDSYVDETSGNRAIDDINDDDDDDDDEGEAEHREDNAADEEPERGVIEVNLGLRHVDVNHAEDEEEIQNVPIEPIRVQNGVIELVVNYPPREIPLKKLSLRGFPKITDRSLGYIDQLDLDLLDVSKTNVTAERVKSFILFHPDCRVIHESACVCGPKLHF